MAVKKTAPTKATSSAPKKAAKAKAAPTPEAAAPKTTAAAPKAKAKPKAAPKKAAPKAVEAKTVAPAPAPAPKAKAAAKPKAAAVKLSPTQVKFLDTIAGSGDTGYSTAKPVEIKTIEALLKHKFVKKGAKDKKSGDTKYLISSAGKKHLEAMPATPSTTTSGS